MLYKRRVDYIDYIHSVFCCVHKYDRHRSLCIESVVFRARISSLLCLSPVKTKGGSHRNFRPSSEYSVECSILMAPGSLLSAVRTLVRTRCRMQTSVSILIL